MTERAIKLAYFDDSTGKYYASGEFRTSDTPQETLDAIADLMIVRQLPGLREGHGPPLVWVIDEDEDVSRGWVILREKDRSRPMPVLTGLGTLGRY